MPVSRDPSPAVRRVKLSRRSSRRAPGRYRHLLRSARSSLARARLPGLRPRSPPPEGPPLRPRRPDASPCACAFPSLCMLRNQDFRPTNAGLAQRSAATRTSCAQCRARAAAPGQFRVGLGRSRSFVVVAQDAEQAPVHVSSQATMDMNRLANAAAAARVGRASLGRRRSWSAKADNLQCAWSKSVACQPGAQTLLGQVQNFATKFAKHAR